MKGLLGSIVFHCLWLFLVAAGTASGWYDKTHLAVAKAAGYENWYNAAGADMAKMKFGPAEGANHWFNNTDGIRVTASLVLSQVKLYNRASDREGHIYGAIIASLRAYLKNEEEGRYAAYHMAFCAHYIGDLSMPLHNVPYDEFNEKHHNRNDGIVDRDVFNSVGRIQKNMHPVVIRDEADLARQIAGIANMARRLATRLKEEDRDMTEDEAYGQLGQSASLLKAVISYAKEKKAKGRQPPPLFFRERLSCSSALFFGNPGGGSLLPSFILRYRSAGQSRQLSQA